MTVLELLLNQLRAYPRQFGEKVAEIVQACPNEDKCPSLTATDDEDCDGGSWPQPDHTYTL